MGGWSGDVHHVFMWHAEACVIYFELLMQIREASKGNYASCPRGTVSRISPDQDMTKPSEAATAHD